MDDQTISDLVNEIAPLLIGRFPGKIFQLDSSSLAIDFRLREHGFLFVSVEPALPRLYLIKRRARDLEKQSRPLGAFAASLRKELSHSRLSAVQKAAGERIVYFHFAAEADSGPGEKRTLVDQFRNLSTPITPRALRSKLLIQKSRSPALNCERRSRGQRNCCRNFRATLRLTLMPNSKNLSVIYCSRILVPRKGQGIA